MSTTAGAAKTPFDIFVDSDEHSDAENFNDTQDNTLTATVSAVPQNNALTTTIPAVQQPITTVTSLFPTHHGQQGYVDYVSDGGPAATAGKKRKNDEEKKQKKRRKKSRKSDKEKIKLEKLKEKEKRRHKSALLLPHHIPPPNYICRLCNKPGHYIQFCPKAIAPKSKKAPAPLSEFDNLLKSFTGKEEGGRAVKKMKIDKKNLQSPPPKYVCKLCKVPGHRIEFCEKRSSNTKNVDIVRPKPPLTDCIFWAKGTCRSGDACQFSHAKAPDLSDTMCRFLVRGECAKGENCSYSHDLGRLPCRFFHRSKHGCTKTSTCPYSHVKPLTPSAVKYLDDLEEFSDKKLKQHQDLTAIIATADSKGETILQPFDDDVETLQSTSIHAINPVFTTTTLGGGANNVNSNDPTPTTNDAQSLMMVSDHVKQHTNDTISTESHVSVVSSSDVHPPEQTTFPLTKVRQHSGNDISLDVYGATNAYEQEISSPSLSSVKVPTTSLSEQSDCNSHGRGTASPIRGEMTAREHTPTIPLHSNRDAAQGTTLKAQGQNVPYGIEGGSSDAFLAHDPTASCFGATF